MGKWDEREHVAASRWASRERDLGMRTRRSLKLRGVIL